MKSRSAMRAHECFANPLPVFRVDVVGDIHSNLAAFRSERGSVSLFALRVLQGVGDFFRVVADGREGGVVHGGHKFAGDRLGKDVLPDRGGVARGSANQSVLSSSERRGIP